MRRSRCSIVHRLDDGRREVQRRLRQSVQAVIEEGFAKIALPAVLPLGQVAERIVGVREAVEIADPKRQGAEDNLTSFTTICFTGECHWR